MDHEDLHPTERKRQCCSQETVVAVIFSALGTMNFIVLFFAMTSAQDILVGTYLPTAVAILSLMTPFFLVTVVAPYLIPKVPCLARIVFAVLVDVTGVLLTAVLAPVTWRLVGLCLISLGSGVAETSFLALTAFYEDIALRGYACGTGFGFAIGPLYYTGKFLSTLDAKPPDNRVIC